MILRWCFDGNRSRYWLSRWLSSVFLRWKALAVVSLCGKRSQASWEKVKEGRRRERCYKGDSMPLRGTFFKNYFLRTWLLVTLTFSFSIVQFILVLYFTFTFWEVEEEYWSSFAVECSTWSGPECRNMLCKENIYWAEFVCLKERSGKIEASPRWISAQWIDWTTF